MYSQMELYDFHFFWWFSFWSSYDEQTRKMLKNFKQIDSLRNIKIKMK